MAYDTYTLLFHVCILPIMTYFRSIYRAHKTYKSLEQLYYRAMGIFLGVHKYAPLMVL